MREEKLHRGEEELAGSAEEKPVGMGVRSRRCGEIAGMCWEKFAGVGRSRWRGAVVPPGGEVRTAWG